MKTFICFDYGKKRIGVATGQSLTRTASELETITVVSGALTVKLPGQADWQTFNAGETFTVAAKQRFQLQVAVATAYLCTYG